MILLYILTLTTPQLKTQQAKTSRIRSHIDYFIQTYYILVLILYQNWWKFSLYNGF